MAGNLKKGGGLIGMMKDAFQPSPSPPPLPSPARGCGQKDRGEMLETHGQAKQQDDSLPTHYTLGLFFCDYLL
ncbi:hypothetical protein Baya_11478 [Bagarius yarrelli]|uniref:Uncharacterized protein n=1 Tax=Bagarius yarrelli TaxID=175774 RepID=A0A556V087_BAGYA|nr:hypothetical protein Baya_11478 [Bagarius yarrelli]